MLSGSTIDEVDTVLCRGSVVTKEGGTEQDIKNHISKTVIIHSAILYLYGDLSSYPPELTYACWRQM
jgi:hypothetical protein